MVKAGRVAINPRGEFSYGNMYTKLDMVRYHNCVYVAKRDNDMVYPVDGEDSDDWMYMGEYVSAKIMEGATETNAGSPGLVPAPEAGKQNAYLRGDGVWDDHVKTDATAGRLEVNPEVEPTEVGSIWITTN